MKKELNEFNLIFKNNLINALFFVCIVLEACFLNGLQT